MPTNINFNKTLGIASKATNIVLPSGNTGSEMIFTITTTTANETFQLGGNTGGGITYNYDIDWGDGTPIENVTTNAKIHTYVTPGVHEIKLTGEIYIKSNTDASKWTEFKQWGSNVIIYGVREMFNNCQNMTYSATDAPNLSQMTNITYGVFYWMFRNCYSITSLDLTNWDVSTVTGQATGCFQSMINLRYINISGWDMRNVTSHNTFMRSIGENSAGIGVDIVADDILFNANSTNWYQMFLQAKINSISVRNWRLGATSASVVQMWRDVGNSTGYTDKFNLDLSSWTNTSTLGGLNMDSWCSSAKGMKTIDLTGWDLSNCTSFNSWFINCSWLREIRGLDTLSLDSCTRLTSTFSGCRRLSFNNSNFSNTFLPNATCTSTAQTFYNCGDVLTGADLSVVPNTANWNMSAVTSVLNMFRDNIYRAGEVFTFNWNAPLLTSLYLAFYNTKGIAEINFSGATLPALGNLTQMAQNCSQLERIIFGANCDFSGVSAMNNVANGCGILRRLQFDSAVDFSSVTSMSSIANSTSVLQVSDYDLVLNRMAATNTNAVTMSFHNTNYTIAVSGAARSTLIGNGCTITDAGGI